ncbi:MAG: site-2 protease family protein, partial [Patescibacteria group bacterium]
NLMPIPPLDGSKILFAFLPYSLRRLEDILETYGMLIILLIVFVLFDYFFPIILFIYRFLTGMPFLV